MGILIALIVICSWFIHLYYLLSTAEVNFASPVFYFHIILQAYLYTGLFITAHDSMHKSITKNRLLNDLFGYLSSFLFAALSFNRLKKNHALHHKYPGTENDPDVYIKSQNLWRWWFTFLIRYTTLLQIIMMATAYNILKFWIPETKLWFFWIIPAFLGTIQLFFFGTYIPHKYPHLNDMLPHNARTLKRNHLWAMISCYFFGYHYEHHEFPSIPWWKLYKTKS
ncbi:MAG: fatty acid desaturase [Ignavibacteria bacterium]|nr:fatty acid desaturase [Ignavibacteria bacterium]